MRWKRRLQRLCPVGVLKLRKADVRYPAAGADRCACLACKRPCSLRRREAPGAFLIWVGLAASIVGAIAYFVTVDFTSQLLLFGILVVGLVRSTSVRAPSLAFFAGAWRPCEKSFGF